AFAVVIIGGMGSLGGAAIGALVVGLADNFGKALFPEVSYFTLYAPMALILAVKPTRLFGRGLATTEEEAAHKGLDRRCGLDSDRDHHSEPQFVRDPADHARLGFLDSRDEP